MSCYACNERNIMINIPTLPFGILTFASKSLQPLHLCLNVLRNTQVHCAISKVKFDPNLYSVLCTGTRPRNMYKHAESDAELLKS